MEPLHSILVVLALVLQAMAMMLVLVTSVEHMPVAVLAVVAVHM